MRNRELAHRFIHQLNTAESGSNFWYEENRCYSYSTCIATIREFNQTRYLVLNRHQYSNTTSNHQSLLLQAARNVLPVIRYDSTNISTLIELEILENTRHTLPNEITKETLIELLIYQAQQSAAAATRSRNYKELHLSDELQNLKLASDLNGAEIDPAKVKSLQDRLEQVRREETEARKDQKRQQEEKIKASLERDRSLMEDWWNGTSNSVPYSYRQQPGKYIRLDPTDKHKVQTSGGISFQLLDGRVLYRMWRSNSEYKSSRNVPYNIGGYPLDEIKPGDYIRVGCHTVYAHEIERFITSVGWDDIKSKAA